MQKKDKPFRSLDGFIPQNNSMPRRIGFTVPQTSKPKPSNFPAVGQTLSSYTPTNSVGMDPGFTKKPGVAPELPPVSWPDVSDSPLEESPGKKKKSRSKEKKRRRFGFSWKRLVAVFFLIILGIGGWLGFKFVYNTSKVLHGNVLSILGTTKLKGEDTGRVNILLAGNSSDDVGHDGAQLTDSIMILSVDTKHNTAFMLSVPRDLWVDIPQYGHAKINEAYVDGQSEKFNQSGYFNGGMGLLQQVIEENFNININYYGLVDYNAMRDMVNAVGGIDINIQSSDPRGLYDPSIDYTTNGPLVKLTNGTHHLTGQQALDLARARGDDYRAYGFPQSDFDRTSHQQQELLALRSKILSTGVLTNPLKISSLLDAVGNNVQTNFSPSEIHRLYDLVKDIPSASIKSVTLNNVNGSNLLMNYTSATGESALIPASGLDDFSDIDAFLNKITSSNPVVVEGASVVVLNGTNTTGLAGSTATTLKSKGLTIQTTGDATAVQPTTTIIDASNNADPATKKLLTTLYGNHFITTNPYAATYPKAAFIIILGQDQVPKTTTNASASGG